MARWAFINLFTTFLSTSDKLQLISNFLQASYFILTSFLKNSNELIMSFFKNLISSLLQFNPLAPLANSLVTKKMKCCEFDPWSSINKTSNDHIMNILNTFFAVSQLLNKRTANSAHKFLSNLDSQYNSVIPTLT